MYAVDFEVFAAAWDRRQLTNAKQGKEADAIIIDIIKAYLVIFGGDGHGKYM